MLEKIINFFTRYDPKLHPENILCPVLTEKLSHLNLQFFKYNIPHAEDAYHTHPASRSLLGYIPVAQPNKMEHFKYQYTIRGWEDLALTPQVELGGQEEFYIPMIDFIGKPTRYDFEVFANKLVLDCPFLKGNYLFIFDSGNSFHGYIGDVITKREWEDFLFFLGGAPFVDQDWIKLGAVCLRWSKGKKSGTKKPQLSFTIPLK